MACLVRSSIPHTKNRHLSSADLLVVDFEAIRIVSSYILPATSDWEHWSEVSPQDRVDEVITTCTSTATALPLLWLGDLNARTADENTSQDWPRSSIDGGRICGRGRWLLERCEETNLIILNGTSKETSSPGAYTSHQPGGSSVIDYAIANRAMVEYIKSMTIEGCKEYSDHDLVTLQLTVPPPLDRTAQVIPRARARHSQARQPKRKRDNFKRLAIPAPVDPLTRMPVPASSLDQLFLTTVHMKRTELEKCMDLYGEFCAATGAECAWTGGCCIDPGVRSAAAGAGVYWGEGNARNAEVRVMGGQTKSRGELLAVGIAIWRAAPNKELRVFSDSEYAVRTLCHWGGRLAEEGWVCRNADLIRWIVLVIKARPCRVFLTWVQGSRDTVGNDKAERRADRGARLQKSDAFKLPAAPEYWRKTDSVRKTADGLKIATHLVPKPAPGKGPANGDKVISPPVTERRKETHHRGRNARRARQLETRRLLLEAAKSSPSKFWDFVDGWIRPQRVPVTIEVDMIAPDFCERLNPPEIPPPHFDVDWLQRAELITGAIPTHTIDLTDEGWFTRPFTSDDVAYAKAKAKEHGSNSSPGTDSSTYDVFMDIPTAKLCELFNACIESLDVPHTWLTTILIPILKPGRDDMDPKSYRLVALESCMLKMLTLMIDNRIKSWGEATRAVPDSQNGFRAGYRTNNNAFILRAAIDKAAADGKTLYVLFLDLTNAFPSTNLPTLWSQLYAMGVSGPLFDWLRVLYDRMAYLVRVNGELSDAFVSRVGVLTGDSASPGLWNLFMSDLILQERPGDIHLADRWVAHVEQADDCALWSTSMESLQKHLADVVAWCGRKGLSLNALKTFLMAFGWLPRVLLEMRIGDMRLAWVDHTKYVGVTYQSTSANVAKEHYNKKAKAAHSVACVILGTESHIGSLSPVVARQLYFSLLDPHLTHGCDVFIDVDLPLLKHLETVQISFLRRVLRLNRRSLIHVLFSEMGIMPIRYRRLELALKWVKGLIALPKHHLAYSAWVDALEVARTGQSSYVGDLVLALKALPHPVILNIHRPIEMTDIDDLLAGVKDSCERYITVAQATSVRTPLLQARRDGSAMKFRHYLHISAPVYRMAFTNLVLGNHPLAVERLRWGAANRQPDRRYAIPRHMRLCRFCAVAVENEGHAILECDADVEISTARATFWASMIAIRPDAHTHYTGATTMDTLANLAFKGDDLEVATLLGKLAWHVFQTYSQTVMYVPSRAAVEGDDGPV